MGEHKTQGNETFSDISKQYFNDEKYSFFIANYNKMTESEPLAADKTILIPPHLYNLGKVTKEEKDGKQTYNLSLSKVSKSSNSGLIFYAPGRNEYFEVEKAGIDALKTSVEDLHILSQEIQDVRKLFESGDASKENLQKAQELEEKVKEKFSGISDNPSGAIQELLLIKSNKKWGELKSRVYINPRETEKGKIKGHWRKHNDKTIQNKLQGWLKQNDGKPGKNELQKNLKAVLWKSEQIETQWPWDWKFKADKDTETKAGYFKGSAEAQFFRFVAGVQADTEFNLNEMKFKLSGHADLSYSLAEATVTGSWCLPDKDGFYLFDLIELVDGDDNKKEKAIIKNNAECRFRYTATATGKAFVGASITACVALPNIDFGSEDKNASGGGSGEGFAGASAEGSLSAKAEWTPSKTKDFDSLAVIAGVAAGNAGLGAGAKLKISYKSGNVRFEMGVMATLGIGGKCGTAFEVGIDEGFELVAHILNSVNYHYVKEIFGNAYGTLRDYSFVCFKEAGEIVGDAVEDALEDVKDIGGWLKRQIEIKAGQALSDAKSFIRNNINDKDKLKKAFPETLGGMVLKTLMATVEAEDFDAVIKVLKSAKSDHELKCILRNVSDLPKQTSDQKGEALQDGIKMLLGFGGYFEEDDELKKVRYLKDIFNILRNDKIGTNYEEI